jgi:hypothetical protein
MASAGSARHDWPGRPIVLARAAPAGSPAVQVVSVTTLACTLPAETGIPLSRWSSTELAVQTVTRGITESISASTVRRILNRNAIKPWQHRSWIFPRDPAFESRTSPGPLRPHLEQCPARRRRVRDQRRREVPCATRR